MLKCNCYKKHNLLVICQKFSDLDPRAISALRYFQTFVAVRCPRRKTSEWVGSFIFILGYHHINFFILSVQVSGRGCDYCIWNRWETLKARLLPSAQNGRKTNWFGLIDLHKYLTWNDFYHYEWKFRIQKVYWNVHSTEKRTNFHFQSEKDDRCTYELLSIYTPPL